MTTPDRDEPTLAAEYVLGLLEGEAKAEAERRLAADAAFAREVESWRVRFAEFDDTTEPQPAGDALWRRIESSVPYETAKVADRPPTLAGFWNNVALLRTAALGATVAALVLAVGLGFAIRAARQQPTMVAVLLDGDRAGAVVQAFADGRVVLVPLAGINLPPGRAIEVWTQPSREGGMVSVGVMNQIRTLELTLRNLPALRPDQLFALSLEPVNGSPTGQPTGPVLFKGTSAQAL